ncbi:MAG: acyl-CoA thioesterase [Deltaproteobacteria bacterium]|nr:acyl-CoA thioesterase [Deltaproteobacteria bacterium]
MRSYLWNLVVDPSAVDGQGHVNNVAVVQWVQDVAVAHSRAVGLGPEDYEALGGMFVVRRHAVEYLRAAYLGDALTVSTWIDGASRIQCERLTEIKNAAGDLVVTARTTWVYLHRASLRPVRIPPAVRSAFSVTDPV